MFISSPSRKGIKRKLTWYIYFWGLPQKSCMILDRFCPSVVPGQAYFFKSDDFAFIPLQTRYTLHPWPAAKPEIMTASKSDGLWLSLVGSPLSGPLPPFYSPIWKYPRATPYLLSIYFLQVSPCFTSSCSLCLTFLSLHIDSLHSLLQPHFIHLFQF